MNSSILYFILAISLALLLSVFLYFFPKGNKKKLGILFILRFLSIVAILTLLINPHWDKLSYTTIKPQLIVALDNSASINYVNGKAQVQSIVEKVRNDKGLQDKFDIKSR